MVLAVHILAGAAASSAAKSAFPGLLFSLLTHYLLDLLPHREYPIKNIAGRNWKKSFPDFLKVSTDFFSGFLILYFFSGKNLLAFAGGLVACLPDSVFFLNLVFSENRFLEKHQFFHSKIIHRLENKKIPVFWRILSQVAAAFVSLSILVAG